MVQQDHLEVSSGFGPWRHLIGMASCTSPTTIGCRTQLKNMEPRARTFWTQSHVFGRSFVRGSNPSRSHTAMAKRLMREEKAQGQPPRFEPVSAPCSLNLLAETDLNLTLWELNPVNPRKMRLSSDRAWAPNSPRRAFSSFPLCELGSIPTTMW